MPVSSGVHHITAICGEPARAIDFYSRRLGLRLVKKTVNFDDATAWHFYFGDEIGSPGSILTFFARPDMPPGTPGAGEVVSIAYAIPTGSAAFWIDQFNDEGVRFALAEGGRAIAFHDPDGLALELVETTAVADMPGYESETIPGEHALRGFAGATLLVGEAAATARVLTQGLGWTEGGRATLGDYTRIRFDAPGKPAIGGALDLLARPGLPKGTQGIGGVHHIAFRASGDAQQAEFSASVRALGLTPTEVRDRKYFRSIYFREPSGVLFEIATDGPGFSVDEKLSKLGTGVMLPEHYEARRKEILEKLPKAG
jgi:glyoxalase family protein